MSNDFQPYVGPRPFEREDADKGRFFGRDSEASDLLSRVIAHSVVLFYSQSGAGKTSLINARLIPKLEKKGFEILKPARVRGLRPQNIKREDIQNMYVFNVLRSWDDNSTDPKSLLKTSIADFLKRREQAGNRPDGGSPRIAIFDQFEELFTFYPERWEDRKNFFEQVGVALDSDRLMRAVFVMREDYIAELDPYLSLLPEKLRTRYRLERLREQEALMAVTGPLEGTEYSYTEGVAEELVNNLLMVPVEMPTGLAKAKGEFVEPVQLQVVCQSLWENCQSSWQDLNPAEPKIITREHLETFGDVDVALSTFYENAIKKVVQGTGISEGKLRSWFEEALITPIGTRGAVYRGKKDTGSIPTAIADELVNQHLVGGEMRSGAKWLELTHDRLIEPIKASNERWRLRYSEGETTRKLLEARAAQWVHNGRNDSDLLDEAEFLEAKRWLESPSATDLGYSNMLFALVQASRAAIDEAAREREQALAAEQQRRAEAEREKVEVQQQRIEEQTRSARYLRRLIAALAVMFLLAVAATVWARHQRKQAVINEEAARQSAQKADEARVIAEDQRKQTEKAKQLVDERAVELQQANEKVKEERSQAEEQRRIAIAQAAEAKKAKQQAQDARRQAEKQRSFAEEKAVSARYVAIRLFIAQLGSKERDALSFRKEGKFDEALEIYRELVEFYSEYSPRRQRRILVEMADTYHAQGNLAEEQKVRDEIARMPIPIDMVLLETIKERGIEAAINQYYELKKDQPDKYDFSEDALNDLGYVLLRDNKVKEAIEVFKLNVEAYPEASNPYDSLGEAYMIAGNKELAILNYEKSVALDPENTNGIKMLKKLKAEK